MKEECFYLRRTLRGLANVLDHLCFALQTLLSLPKQFVCVKVAVQKAAKGTGYIGQSTESSGFPTASLRPVIRCSANSVRMMSIENVYVQTKTTCGSEAHVKNKEKRHADGKRF